MEEWRIKTIPMLTIGTDREAVDQMREHTYDGTRLGLTIDALKSLCLPESMIEDFDVESINAVQGLNIMSLAITRRFCQMLGGDVDVTSEPGRGSTFSIDLPAESVAPEAAERTAREAPREPWEVRPEPGQGPLVLVIDDEEAARDLLARTLAREGFAVRSARTGEEGVALAQSLRPAVITLDVMMPGVDGWAVLRQLKSHPATAEIDS